MRRFSERTAMNISGGTGPTGSQRAAKQESKTKSGAGNLRQAYGLACYLCNNSRFGVCSNISAEVRPANVLLYMLTGRPAQRLIMCCWSCLHTGWPAGIIVCCAAGVLVLRFGSSIELLPPALSWRTNMHVSRHRSPARVGVAHKASVGRFAPTLSSSGVPWRRVTTERRRLPGEIRGHNSGSAGERADVCPPLSGYHKRYISKTETIADG
ncbi:uncharacterized protein V1510DRAFT_99670 [Dipodascopsis tothii]|uniref:uncharacterized protein n=1 Tax=Dipodascopsis tothii TaxID=44089 RepID=UPI0034CF3102